MRTLTLRWAATVMALLALTSCAAGSPARIGPITTTDASSTPTPQTVPTTTPTGPCLDVSPASAVPGGLPSLVLDCLDGSGRADMAAVRGPVVVNLWAQWCEPCRAEAPHLSTFSRQTQVALLGVDSADPRPELAREFVVAAGWTYPQLTDPDKAVLTARGLPGLPASLFIDADGTVVATKVGGFSSVDEIRSMASDAFGVTW